MKIDLDLSEIFSEGGEDVNDSIKDMIVNTVTQKIYLKIEKEINAKVNTILEKGIKEKLDAVLAELIPSLMDYEFQETERYGAAKEKTSVKNRILKALQDSCTFEDKRYSSDCNAFTQAMKAIIEKQMKIYTPMFDKEINAEFTKEAMEYAQTKLKGKFGIK